MKPIPSSSTIQAALDAAYEHYKSADSGGANANYIPFLASVPSHLFGIAAVTARGDTFAVGDYQYEFAIESISKAFNLGLVMNKLGPAALRTKIGSDPTGEPFNSVMALELHHGKPLNSLVNAGAMATVSLVEGYTANERWKNIMTNMDGFAGRPLTVNDQVYKSESETNQHNKGIAWLLDSYGFFYGSVPETVDLYTRMCSIAVTAKDLAVMGATYANGGMNPLTQKQVVSPSIIPAVLSELALNGLYDSTGDWMYKNGVPGKSGVGGGLVAIIPGCMAIAAFSPPLDECGNSVKGQLALKDIIDALNLNLFKP